MPQDKIPGHDLWMHCLTALDAAATIDPGNERLRLAALLHDIGKPTTFADGHFVGHDTEGAKMAEALLVRLAFPRREIEPMADADPRAHVQLRDALERRGDSTLHPPRRP